MHHERRTSSYDLQGWKLHLCQKITFYYNNNNQNITSLTAYENIWVTITAIKKIIVYYDKNSLLHTAKIVCESLGLQCYKRFRKLFSCNFCACDLLQLTRMFPWTPNFLCACIGTYRGDHTSLLGRPDYTLFLYIKIMKYRWVWTNLVKTVFLNDKL